MTDKEKKLIKKHLLTQGIKWADILAQFEQKHIDRAKQWAKERKNQNDDIDALLASVQDLPEEPPTTPAV